MEQFDEYWQAVSRTVCVKCIDGDSNGHCRLGNEQECGLKIHFRSIVGTILSVESDKLGPYVRALRQNVCANCRYQSADGMCTVRLQIDCALDRYFAMIVDIIEEARVPLNEQAEAFGD
jgi:hypothetical protein